MEQEYKKKVLEQISELEDHEYDPAIEFELATNTAFNMTVHEVISELEKLPPPLLKLLLSKL